MTHDLSDFHEALDDMLLQRWTMSSQHGRGNVISVVERLMNGEIVEVIRTEIPAVVEAKDEISDILTKCDTVNFPSPEWATMRLLAVIARAMVDKKTPNNRKSFFITGE